jgi:protease-4
MAGGSIITGQPREEADMKKLVKIVLALVLILVGLQIIAMMVMYYVRRIPEHTVLTVRISGDIPEQPLQDGLRDLLAGPTLTVTDIVAGLDRARSDSRITGVIAQIGESTLNMASIQEIRDRLWALNRAGKFTVGYLEFATNRSYYLASACQTVTLLPKSLFYIHGMMASTTFYRGGLDKLGVYPDFYHIGDYKNATNVLTEKKYTPAHREATEVLLEDWYQEYLQGVAESRRLKPADVEAAVAKGPLTSDAAQNARLVDRLGYWDEVLSFAKRRNAGEENRLNLRTYLDRTNPVATTKLAVIYAVGDILPGRSGQTPWGGEVMGSETVAEQFRRAREDDDVKAVILRVDSPGGAVFASEVIRREEELTARVKPVVVSMSDVAASGGYWIAMSANRIIAEPGTITGSIGVLTGKFNLLGLYQKLGLGKDLVTTTENSTLEYAFQNFTPAQKEAIQQNMRATYHDFVAGVARGRHMKFADVDKIAQGRVWSGERARQLGLVDELGGLHTAIARARQLAKIPPDETVSLIYLPPRRSLLERLLSLAADARTLRGTLSLRAWLAQLEALARQPVWVVLPAVPEVQ